MFIQEQESFKEEFFRELFDPYEKVDYSKRSTLFINAVLEEDNLPYVFYLRKEDKGDNKGKHYWWLVDLNKI